MPMKLNRKCAMAILMAALELNEAARKAVMVVPMLAPRINGTADRSFTNFLATSGTTRDVVTVLERMRAVVNNPHPKDLTGILKKNCWNLSGEPTPNKEERTFLKNRIDPNSNAKAITKRINPLSIEVTRKSMTGLKPLPKKEKLLFIGPVGS